MESGEAGGEAAVLHAHLYADGFTLCGRQAQQTADEPAQSQAAEVVKYDYADDDHSAEQQLRGVGGDDYQYDEGDGKRRKGGQVGRGLVGELWP